MTGYWLLILGNSHIRIPNLNNILIERKQSFNLALSKWQQNQTEPEQRIYTQLKTFELFTLDLKNKKVEYTFTRGVQIESTQKKLKLWKSYTDILAFVTLTK